MTEGKLWKALEIINMIKEAQKEFEEEFINTELLEKLFLERASNDDDPPVYPA
jgi:hypothetical protein